MVSATVLYDKSIAFNTASVQIECCLCTSLRRGSEPAIFGWCGYLLPCVPEQVGYSRHYHYNAARYTA